MIDLTRYPSPIRAWDDSGYVPYGNLGVSLAQDWVAAGDPALNATTLMPWWLASLLDGTVGAATTLRDWNNQTTPGIRLSTAAAAGSRRRLVGTKPIRLQNAHAVYLRVNLHAATGGGREITMALDNYEDATGAVIAGADRGVRLTFSSATGLAVVGYNNVAASAEQITPVLLNPAGEITLAMFPDTGHIGVWVSDQCILLRRPPDINANVEASAQLVRPRFEIKATSATATGVDMLSMEFAAFMGGPVMGVPLTGS